MRVASVLRSLRMCLFVAAGLMLLLHAVSGSQGAGPAFGGLILPALSYIPALPLSLLALAVMLMTAGRGWRRKFAITLAAMHYLLCGDYAPSRLIAHMGDEAFAHAESFRVGAANVQYLQRGPAYVGRELAKLEADVWLLSEFETTSAQEQEFIAQDPSYDLIIGQSRDVAVLSRLPVLAWREIPLPSRQTSLRQRNSFAGQANNPQRSFLHVTIDTKSGPVHLLPLRFIAGRPPSDDPLVQLRWGRYLLREQAREVEAFVRYASHLEGPVIFGGDLNATHASVAVRRLRTIARDVYLADNPFGDYTFRTFTPWLPPVPTLRLDYLFANNEVRILRSWRELKAVSDHYPILGDFAIGSIQR